MSEASKPHDVQDAAGGNPDDAGGNSGRPAPSQHSRPDIDALREQCLGMPSNVTMAHDFLDVLAYVRSLEEQLEAAHRNMDRYGMALAEIAAAAGERVKHGRPDINSGWVESVARVALGSNPASDPLGYIELDDRGNCRHGVHKGLGCRFCDPAQSPAMRPSE